MSRADSCSDRCVGVSVWRLWALAASLTLCASCKHKVDGLVRTGVWETGPTTVIVEFYYCARDVPEADMKRILQKISKPLLKKHSKVEVYVFFDRSFAMRIAREDVRRRVATGMTVWTAETVLVDREMKIQGGAMLRTSKERGEEKWHFVARRKATG